MDKKLKYGLILVGFGVVLYVGLNNLGSVWSFITGLISLLLPVTAGLIIAFILNVPMSGFEKLFAKMFKKKKKYPKKLFSVISLLLTLICILLVIALAVNVALPSLIDSAKGIYKVAQDKIPELIDYLKKHNIDTTKISEWAANFDFNEEVISKLTDRAGSLLSSAMSIASATVSGIINIVFAIVLAIYVLMSKDSLGRHVKKLIYAKFKINVADRIFYVSSLTKETFSKFLSGQCVEAVILGVFIFITFSIFRIPYAAVIGVLTGISAFIPYVGAFSACALGTLFVLITEPSKAILCVIVYVCTQFVENQFIYPHVVGSSVGLSALWTLVAALVGGKLMGLFGMIFFIPLTAVIFTLLRENINKDLEKKFIVVEEAEEKDVKTEEPVQSEKKEKK